MKLRATYTLSFLANLPDGFDRHLQIHLEGKVFQMTHWNDTERRATAIVEAAVNREGLSIQTGPTPLDGSEPTKGISVPERLDVGRFLPRIVHILSFLTDVPIRYAHKLGGDSLVPESSDDAQFLESFETWQVHEELTATVSVRSFSLPSVGSETLNALASKELGLALYAQALLLQEPIAAYREFWKVLESAFGEKDDQLICCLADYAPAQRLGFTGDELRQLHTLRGRASHAESRSGVKEHRFVFAETTRRLPRLKCLVEQIILTKKTWGVRTTATERLAPVVAYADSNDRLVLIRPNPSKENEK